MNRKVIWPMLAAMAIVLSSFTSGKKITVNGKPVELEDGIYTKIITTKGEILIRFELDKAPMTSGNFIALAEGKMPHVSDKLKGKKYFDGLTFHRVIPDFMIQGGDPEGNGMGGPGYEFPNEIHADLVHKKGVISMANAGPNTNGSQFFITVAETSFLNGNYSVFGTVLEGQEVADAISKVERSAEDRPNEPVIMTKVEIIRVGKNFLKWDAVAAFNKGRADFEARQMQIKKEAEEAKAMQEAFVLSKYPNATISSTGLRYIVHDIGSGRKPNNGEIVAVHYAGYFLDGKLFDSSIKAIAEANEQYNPQREPYAPMEVPYGPSAQLIPGFKEGMMLLNVGGKATLIIPPSLAYGERGAGGVIPPNAWLIFDIELVSVK